MALEPRERDAGHGTHDLGDDIAVDDAALLRLLRAEPLGLVGGPGRLAQERDTIRAVIARRGERRGPIRGFVIPTLRSIGLFSDRIRGHFDDMFRANIGAGYGDLDDDPELPADLEAWVEASG